MKVLKVGGILLCNTSLPSADMAKEKQRNATLNISLLQMFISKTVSAPRQPGT